ncbi:MAG TPA: glycosyltransferase family A protein [Thermoleophilaceae bacterium]
MEITFVQAPRQNAFFGEIVEAIRDELRRAGVDSSVSHSGFPPPRRGMVYALVPPHEWFALHARRHPPTTGQLQRTVGICAEQPGTSFFEDDVTLAASIGAVMDINAAGVRELGRRGVRATHFPLGWTPSWSHWSPDASEGDGHEPARDVDVLHLGIHSDRRAAILAESARHLARWRCHLNLGDDHGPNFRPQANYVTGAAKWELLRRSRTLLNIHVGDRPYFEWTRVVQAICNGCVVVSEHSSHFEPLVAGHHFVSARPEALALLAQPILEVESRRASMARDAWHLLKEQLPLRDSVARLIEAAHDLDRHPVFTGVTVSIPLQSPAAPLDSEDDDRDEFERATSYPHLPGDHETSVVRHALKATQLEVIGLRRELARSRLEALDGETATSIRVAHESPAYRAARPRVSVLVSLFNYDRHVRAALDSCAASSLTDIELVVVDDGSSDRSRQVVREWSEAKPAVPLLLLAHPCNRGLSAARNSALDFARAELAFILDADNCLYPAGLERLVAALDQDPEVAFAYGMLEVLNAGRSVGLRSFYPWRPARLRTGNYIDAMALWRTRSLRELGGYTDDLRLYGWEDYDLWCRAAEREVEGVLVPEIVARYRSTGHSMLAVTNISWKAAVSLLVDRHPKLMANVQPPP